MSEPVEITASHLRSNLANILGRIADGPARIVSRGEPVAVLVSPERYAELVAGHASSSTAQHPAEPVTVTTPASRTPTEPDPSATTGPTVPSYRLAVHEWVHVVADHRGRPLHGRVYRRGDLIEHMDTAELARLVADGTIRAA